MRIHFIAIGGSAMHDLAIALHREGHEVSGSDDGFFDPSKSRLQEHGLLPEATGWFPERIDESIDRVILGMHAKTDNPELARARELGIAIQSFPEFIAEQSRDKERIVIAGSHGKTSITAMVLHAMKRNGMEPDRLVGAQLEGYDGAVSITQKSDRIVIEGDEYLSSPIDPRPKFLWYAPHIALISGIAWDHVNVFPTYEDYLDAFRRFIDSIQDGGTLIYCEEDDEVKKLVEAHGQRLKCLPYGTHPHHPSAEGVELETDEGTSSTPVFGAHNMQNLAGAMRICEELGLDREAFYRSMQDFHGASLRLETIYEKGGAKAYRDYAHAPSKVRATVDAVKQQHPSDPLIAVLELHTFSSLDPNFIGHYAKSMDAADTAFVFYDPKAVEKKGHGELPEESVRKAFARDDLRVYTDMSDLQEELSELVRMKEASKLLFMSSGAFQGKDLEGLSEELLS